MCIFGGIALRATAPATEDKFTHDKEKRSSTSGEQPFYNYYFHSPKNRIERGFQHNSKNGNKKRNFKAFEVRETAVYWA